MQPRPASTGELEGSLQLTGAEWLGGEPPASSQGAGGEGNGPPAGDGHDFPGDTREYRLPRLSPNPALAFMGPEWTATWPDREPQITVPPHVHRAQRADYLARLASIRREEGGPLPEQTASADAGAAGGGDAAAGGAAGANEGEQLQRSSNRGGLTVRFAGLEAEPPVLPITEIPTTNRLPWRRGGAGEGADGGAGGGGAGGDGAGGDGAGGAGGGADGGAGGGGAAEGEGPWIGWDTASGTARTPFPYVGWGTGSPVPPAEASPRDTGGGGLADWLIDEVSPGSLVAFDRPDHRFYDTFPGGRIVKPTVAFVDLQLHKRVLEVREAWFTAEGPRRRGRRNRRRGETPLPDLEQIVTAVRIRSENGTMVWTLFAKGNIQLMSVIDERVWV